MRITPVACLKDNYAYLVTCERTGSWAVVDPSEEAPVAAALDAAKARITAIWSTHHHFDHVGGNEALVKRYGVSEVFGHASDRGRVPGQTKFLNDGDRFRFGAIDVRAIHIPGHTTGAVGYLCTEEGEAPAVFTGDTLFLAGCGRLFEGNPPMMHESLAKLLALPPETRVYCGHEYTESNLRFAAHVEPDNAAVARAREDAARKRANGEPTVPGTMAHERETNPFLRVTSATIRKTLGIPENASGAEALGAIRAAKDAFRG